MLRLRQLLLDLFQLVLKEVDQIVVLTVACLCRLELPLVAAQGARQSSDGRLRHGVERSGNLVFRLFELLDLRFVTLDDLLEKV